MFWGVWGSIRRAELGGKGMIGRSGRRSKLTVIGEDAYHERGRDVRVAGVYMRLARRPAQTAMADAARTQKRKANWWRVACIGLPAMRMAARRRKSSGDEQAGNNAACGGDAGRSRQLVGGRTRGAGAGGG